MANPERELIVDKQRLLGSMGEKPCPLGCIYCFVNAEGYSAPEKVDTPKGREKLEYEIENGDIQVLFPTCDTELFLLKDWYKQLVMLTKFGLPINIATKSRLNESHTARLKSIDDLLKQKGAILHIGISITRLYDWKEIEQHTPSPESRIMTTKILKESGIATTTIIKPTLPFVPKDEFAELITRTAPYCESYITGPLYLTPEMENYIVTKYPGHEISLSSPSWMANNPSVKTVNTDETVDIVKKLASQYDRPVFDNAPQAVKYAMLLREL